MLRRFGLAQAVLHEPDLLLLDEPTAGLDATGFEALATTSAGFAWSQGRDDYAMTRDDLVEHVRLLAVATELPLNVDSERCFADDLDGVAETVRLLHEAGAAGCSIEDWNGPAGIIDPIGLAAERVAAASEAADVSGDRMVLTARAENLLEQDRCRENEEQDEACLARQGHAWPWSEDRGKCQGQRQHCENQCDDHHPALPHECQHAGDQECCKEDVDQHAPGEVRLQERVEEDLKAQEEQEKVEIPADSALHRACLRLVKECAKSNTTRTWGPSGSAYLRLRGIGRIACLPNDKLAPRGA